MIMLAFERLERHAYIGPVAAEFVNGIIRCYEIDESLDAL